MNLKTLMASLLLAPVLAFANPTININTADSEALVDGLTGVGPEKAMAIIRYRQTNGPFRQVNDLVQVKGIGQGTVERNRAYLSVGEQASQP
ncbi:competence ComEA-like helix-hairpin-helix protein [Thiogranum longum]|uniref:Competence ComEA-like helix-hairpin-helix protein n=1 Tax=Thiogranum longum TaxID=1537524 RepID=A0A4V2PGT7_9GAMM|nr:helix-hairpin-helix domain-containing protein [Thiogranum longum]TCK18096.1 competence ComEA-like helix-hairpin-helix protein [Thiogranum longum]